MVSKLVSPRLCLLSVILQFKDICKGLSCKRSPINLRGQTVQVLIRCVLWLLYVEEGLLTFDLGCSSPFLGGNECDKCIQCVSTRDLSVLDTINHSNTAITPWIAFVSCDTNVTNDSTTDDIFTIARDSGAVAAVRSFHPVYIFKEILSTEHICSCYTHNGQTHA